MPAERILDAHVHLWNPDRIRMPWLDLNQTLNFTADLDRYAEATADLPIEGLVYLEVDCAPAYGLIEAREISRLAINNPIIKAIIAWAPLEYGERLRLYLEELSAVDSLVKGVRRITQDDPDPDLCLQPDFIRGAEILPEYGLTCDLCCRYRQLGQTVELVRRVPGTSFILDHIGKPNIRAGEFEPWASQITDLATLPNVVCKVSGVVTEADLVNWTVEEIEPYVAHVLESFGEDRVVFGSDWPVVTMASSHRRWVEALDQITASLTPAARDKLWYGNGAHFYRIAEE